MAQMDWKTSKAYQGKLTLQRLWSQTNRSEAETVLKKWYALATHNRLESVIGAAKMNQASLAGHSSVRRQPDHDGNRRGLELQDKNSDETDVPLQDVRVPAHRHLLRRWQDQHSDIHSSLKRTSFKMKNVKTKEN
jgi:hypothetical protein